MRKSDESQSSFGKILHTCTITFVRGKEANNKKRKRWIIERVQNGDGHQMHSPDALRSLRYGSSFLRTPKSQSTSPDQIP